MIDVDVTRYLSYTDQHPRDAIQYGARLMQWSSYVKRRISPLTSAEELDLLAKDAEVMGCAGWWFS